MVMKTLFNFLLLSLAVTASANSTGEDLFRQFCNGCHYNGGNSVRKEKPLYKLYRRANGFDSAESIKRKIREGGNGMPSYSNKRISESDALKIAEHILKTY